MVEHSSLSRTSEALRDFFGQNRFLVRPRPLLCVQRCGSVCCFTLTRSVVPRCRVAPADACLTQSGSGADGAPQSSGVGAASAPCSLLRSRSVRPAYAQIASARVMQRLAASLTLRFAAAPLPSRSATALPRTQHAATRLAAAPSRSASFIAFATREQRTATAADSTAPSVRDLPSSSLAARPLSRPLPHSTRLLTSTRNHPFTAAHHWFTTASAAPDNSLSHLMAQAAADSVSNGSEVVRPFKVRLYFVRHGESQMNTKAHL